MSEENVYANHNFILNGDFQDVLNDWIINDEIKVTRQEGLWQGKTIGFMNAVNMGEGYQTITLAPSPRPEPGKADYKLIFWYEAVQGAVGTLRINPGLGGEVDLRLVPSREAEAEQALNLDQPLLDLNLTEYAYPLTLDAAETTVRFTVISPDNGGPGRPGAVRVTFMRLELQLELLQLDSVMIDDEQQSPAEPLHLCFGAHHDVALQVTGGNAWNGTYAGLLVNGGVSDPENILSASPRWGLEHPVSAPWTITCAGIVEDKEVEHTLHVRSYYTADLYPLRTVSGHFQLDVISLQEAAYYPVIDLDQSVELRVRVESHYTKTPLANRLVTWTLKGPTPADDIVLDMQPSGGNGEAGFTWTPDVEGDWEIVASVDSHYEKDDARHVFKVRVLKEDPWLSATFALDGSPREWMWGAKTGYPCRGATHEVRLAFLSGHALADSELSLHWTGEDTPEGLGVTFNPKLETGEPVVGSGLAWRMACENRRDSVFEFHVSCSKLLNRSPSQTLNLAHNWLAIGDVKPPSRFPAVGGPKLPMSVQIRSQVPGVEAVREVDVQWSIDGTPEPTLPTGADGWCEYGYDPVAEGPFKIKAKAVSPYDDAEPGHEFTVTVLAEDPWSKLVTVTLDGQKEGSVGLLCFRDAQPVDLLILPGDDTLLDEEIYLDLKSDADLGFDFEPSMKDKRRLTRDGLIWTVRSTADISAPFQLHVCHDELAPYALQGRLLSQTLEDDGTFTFDGKELALENMAYPCLGGQHTLAFTPKAGSLLTGLEVAAKWASSNALDVTLAPDHARDLPSNGLEWTLDARAGTESGALGLSLELNQAGFTYPPVPMSLGHNRIKIADVRGPTFDMFVGETAFLEIKAQSYYTERSVPGVVVSYEDGDTVTPVPTQETGWARFAYTATQAGPVEVIATVPSPYDGPDDAPSFTFEFTVLAAAPMGSDSPPVSTSTTMTDEGSLMSEEQEPGHNAIEIGEVREAAFDPVVGESVWLGINVRSSGTRRAASGVEVVFTAELEHARVETDGEGWAYFAYKAEQAKDVQVVVATLEGVSDGAEADPFHTFRFKVLAAGVWDDARIQLNADVPSTVWGEETRFPRTTQAHTIKLVVDNASSHLLGRDVCLGLKGDSLPSELGITNVQPALGVARALTAEGLSWQCTGTIGGAYNLQLEASRLLKQSPVNAMSLGPVPSAGLPAAIVYRVGNQPCEIKDSEIVVKIALGSPVEFSISVPPECLNESVSFRQLGEFDMGFDPGLDSPRKFNELALEWTVIASRWGIEDYIYQLTFSQYPDSPQILKFLIE
ncbi:hypothetical protein LOY38_06930 [Pseudomonas sp. B21-015]|uniref:hypothetical protein n=1 Tax=Pseudomonas sp. B21-015 TaxID=2895473 RepID=UPI002160736D|nr:hypothetical protein [Pseudomonas sp. B21-015]UVM51771.1 hypothetical protein LOY38_06930 [Pseudomonas sp. B21-015]